MDFKKSLLVTLLASGVFLNQNIVLAEESSSSGMNYVDGTEETSSSGMDYVDGAEENEADNNHSITESRSQEEVNLDEGIAAEQIIVKITEEGYVTSHGDHYHYYNGEVPEDSIFLESIVTEEDLDSFEKVSEIANGWIVKKDDQYHVWLEEGKKASTVRSTDELLLQANGIDPKDAKAIVGLRKDYHLTDDSLIMPVVDKTPEEVLKDVDFEGQPIVVYITEKEYVLLVGIDLYVFSGEVAEEAYFSELLLAPSDYQLQDADVKQTIKDGFIVKVDDQYKVYQEKNNDHIIDIDTILQQVKKSFAEFQEQDASERERREKVNHVKDGEMLGGSGSRDASGSYVTSDGYVFSPYDVIQDLGDGFIVPHGNHFHFIPKSDLTAAELQIALAVLGKNGNSKPSTSDNSGQFGNNHQNNHNNQGNQNGHVNDNTITVKPSNSNKPYTTSDGYVFSVESITKVERQGIIAKHGSHYHWVPFTDLNNEELQAAKVYIKKHFGIDLVLVNENDKKDKNESPSPQEIPFNAKAVLRKETQNGQVGYVFLANHKEVFKPISELDYQAISFAEQQLNLNENLKYKFEVAKANEGELEPGLYVPLSQLPMHAGSATYDTGDSFIIPHIDHIHIVYYSDLTKEQIATVKYLMQHPEYRPAPWTDEGHEDTVSNEITYVPNVTPKSQRAGLKNWQIVHSVEEVNAALAKGNFANDEGYIFSPEDLKDSATFVWDNGTVSIPKKSGSEYFTLDTNQLPETLKAQAQQIIKERQNQKQEESAEDGNQPEAEISNATLIEFLEKHYQLPPFSVYYQFDPEGFKVYYSDDDFIVIDKAEVLAAYQEKGTLPELPEKEAAPSTTSEANAETTEMNQNESDGEETTTAETGDDVVEPTTVDMPEADIETTVETSVAAPVEETSSAMEVPTTTETVE